MAAPVIPIAVPCSVTALATAIVLAPSDAILSLKTGCTYSLNAALPNINKNVTIQGNNDLIRRGNGALFTALTVNGAQLNINQLRMSGFDGNSTNPGALRNVGGTVTVAKSTFADNEGTDGGAVQNTSNGSFTATNSTFADNEGANGGAFHNRGGAEAWFNQCTFFDNEATGSGGGAIYVSSGHVNVNGVSSGTSQFTDNESTGSAGHGGAINNAGGVVTINFATFSNNETTRNNADGGALNNDGGASTVSNSGFTGNFAGDDGGAIYTSKSLNLTGVTITGNRSDDDGGGVFVNGGNTSLSKTVVSGNIAGGLGGGIRRNGGNVSLTNNTIVKANFPSNCSGFFC
jgi:predicted outer membrane repeat protein